MTNSHFTGAGPVQVQRTGPGFMDPNILYRNLRADPRQEQENREWDQHNSRQLVRSVPVPLPCSVNKS